MTAQPMGCVIRILYPTAALPWTPTKYGPNDAEHRGSRRAPPQARPKSLYSVSAHDPPTPPYERRASWRAPVSYPPS